MEVKAAALHQVTISHVTATAGAPVNIPACQIHAHKRIFTKGVGLHHRGRQEFLCSVLLSLLLLQKQLINEDHRRMTNYSRSAANGRRKCGQSQVACL